MLVLANVLWSLNYATTKYAFGEWLPLAFSATRFLCAGIIFALFVLWREGSLRIRRSDVKLVVATAAVGILLNQLTFNYAVDKTTAGNTALILASAPAFAALFASLAGHEHVQRKHWLALARVGGRRGAGDPGRLRRGRREPGRRPAGGGCRHHLGRLLRDAAAAVRPLLGGSHQRADGVDRRRHDPALRPAPDARAGLGRR